MKRSSYLEVILTVMTVLLGVIAWRLVSTDAPSLVASAHAATVQSGDLVFFPVGNQTLNRLVVWEKTTNTVYDYDSHGNLDNTWVLGTPGQRIQKKD